ncbi:glycine oxidase ThiO [Halalkalibacterium halodurans]|uniref:glycine oxidase n=2 Tax=Halalkalibacterium halodurans TaxID=86665 RepID=Q9KB87_HALH5|nr:glycine oxidase ThiO [Halalkalibacterium halodurans]MDY7222594.1 glycine oxidase ThiO [Halalkalibacterium halodurans]MDY7241815.1 glycine oxidase ThiO [Halalkalibacterium halodurans]MED4123490.1 glycine oxidase ThiO [Halalkalibacterium halodurans]MED4174813.1 glycine oxidase ThiO [Halalkalibacterium halodurans]TPE68696.1 glycine oxidase ThiO [Halalkalibacterium halodurans]
MKERFDLCIIGGGVIGLSIAIHTAKKGANVLVVEKDRLGQEASGGRAGLLTTVAEGVDRHDPYSIFSRESLQYLLQWIPELEEKTQISSGLVKQNLLRLALHEQEAALLEDHWLMQTETNSQIKRLSAEEARTLEPLLSNDLIMAICSPDEYHLEPSLYLNALARMARQLGVTIREQTEVIQFIHQNNRMYGVVTNTGTQIVAETTILAAGAWSHLLSRLAKVKVPVYPLKGQLIVLKQGDTDLNVMINTSKGYILSKPNGTVVLGATSEKEKFNKFITAKGIQELLPLFDYVPELKNWEIQHLWAGLRPATPDGQPIIGYVPEWEGWYLATGHSRHGVLLSGWTGHLVAEELEGKDQSHKLGSFGLHRFAMVERR